MKFLILIMATAFSLHGIGQTAAKLNDRIDSLVRAFNSNKSTVNKNIQNLGITGTKNTNDIASAQLDIVAIKKNTITPDASKFNIDAQGVMTLKTDYDASIASLQKSMFARPTITTDTSLIVKIVGDTAKVNRDRVDAQYRAMYKADQLIRDTLRINRDSTQLISDVVVSLLKSYKKSDETLNALQSQVTETLNKMKQEADNRRLIIQQLLTLIPNLQ